MTRFKGIKTLLFEHLKLLFRYSIHMTRFKGIKTYPQVFVNENECEKFNTYDPI